MHWIALTGLLIPLALHLWNRKQGKEVHFGSIKWLIPAEEKRMSSIKFTDVGLFLVRCLLVLAFVMLLMDLGWWTPLEKQQELYNEKWVLVERTLYEDEAIKDKLKGLKEQGYDLRYFESNFPKVELNKKTSNRRNKKIQPTPNYWSLLKSIDHSTQQPDSVVLLAIPQLKYFRGERPTINYHLDWWPLPYEKTSTHLAKAIQKEYEELELILGRSNEQISQWENFIIKDKDSKTIEINNYPTIEKLKKNTQLIMEGQQESVALENADSLSVLIIYDSNYRKDVRYLEAALRVVNAVKSTVLSTKSLLSSKFETANMKADWVFALTEKDFVNTLLENESLNLVQFQKNNFYQKETFKEHYLGARKYYVMNEHLYPDGQHQVLDLNLPHSLLSLLWRNENKSFQMEDQRVMALAQALPIVDHQKQEAKVVALKDQMPKKEKRSAHWWIWGSIITLFILERFLGMRTASS